VFRVRDRASTPTLEDAHAHLEDRQAIFEAFCVWF